ncbi:hypothetical protein ACN082_09930 [Rothia sp. CCM 9417]|uniref:hypothetical protein n=1 Tax=Rothia sp. CCM 9417 TaxID=3402657 RepID=UPI003ADF30C7
MSLTFNAGSHRYRLDGRSVTGVTTLLGGGVPKPALMGWHARMVAEYVEANPLEIERLRGEPTPTEKNPHGRSALVQALCKVPEGLRDSAGERGTLIHDLGQRYLEGAEVVIPPLYEPEVMGLVALIEALELTPLIVEKSLANRSHWYAGRVDFIGTSPYLNDGQPVLIDWKTSNGVYGETALQAAAYAKAEFWVEDYDPHTEHPLPEITATYVAHIRPGFTELHPLAESAEEIDAHFLQFQYAAEIARKAKDRAGYVKPALNIEELTAATLAA